MEKHERERRREQMGLRGDMEELSNAFDKYRTAAAATAAATQQQQQQFELKLQNIYCKVENERQEFELKLQNIYRKVENEKKQSEQAQHRLEERQRNALGGDEERRHSAAVAPAPSIVINQTVTTSASGIAAGAADVKAAQIPDIVLDEFEDNEARCEAVDAFRRKCLVYDSAAVGLAKTEVLAMYTKYCKRNCEEVSFALDPCHLLSLASPHQTHRIPLPYFS